MLNEFIRKNIHMSNLIEKIRNNIEKGIIAVFFIGFLAGIAVSGIISSLSKDEVKSEQAQVSQPIKIATPAQSQPSVSNPVAVNNTPSLPAYLDTNQIQLVFTYIVTSFNKQDPKSLYNILGPIRKSQLPENTLATKLLQLYQLLGAVQNGSLIEQKYIGQQDLYKVFQFTFRVDYEKVKKGTLNFTVLDDGSNFQIDSIVFN